MRFKVTRSARRHKIGNARIIAAIEAAGAPTLMVSDRVKLRWSAKDDRGFELDVIGIVAEEDPDLVLNIHVIPTEFPEK